MLSLSAMIVAASATMAPVTEVTLFTAQNGYQPGQPITVGIEVKLFDGWHTYWRNPGDSGMATTVDWKLPEGWKAGPLQYPTPARMVLGVALMFGYEEEVLFQAQLTPPAGFTGPAKVTADLGMLVCLEECRPANGSIEFTILPARNITFKQDLKDQLDAWQKKVPAELPKDQGATFKWTATGAELTVPIVKEIDRPTVTFLPHDVGLIDHLNPVVSAKRDGKNWVFELKASEFQSKKPEKLGGVIVELDEKGHPKHRGVSFVATQK